MLINNDNEALYRHLRQGNVIVTATANLAQQLLSSCFKTNCTDSPQVRSFTRLHCYTYKTYLKNLFKKLRHVRADVVHPILLNSQQERYLWQQILRTQHNSYNDGLLHKVIESWNKSQDWQLDYNHPEFAKTRTTRLFQSWCQHLHEFLNVHNCILVGQLANYLLKYPQLFDTDVIWACFDNYTPEQRAVQAAIESNACTLSHYELAAKTCNAHRYCAKDLQDEHTQLILWLQCKLSAGESSIAVIIPDLQTQATRMQRLLEQYFRPVQFNISLAQPLCAHPLISHALQALSIDKNTLDYKQVHLLLHSPYLGGSQTEFHARSEIIQTCELLKEYVVNFKSLIEVSSVTAPILASILDGISSYPLKDSPSAWAAHFKTRLFELGFPGEYPLNAASAAHLQNLMLLLDELFTLSTITPLMEASHALSVICDLARTATFKTAAVNAPIQVLSFAEADGCKFKNIWVSGLSDQCLPPKINLLAFIPIKLQEAMPAAIAAQQLQCAQKLLIRLQHTCDDGVFSYPRFTGDTPNLSSPLIAKLPEYIKITTAIILQNSALISFEENYAIPLQVDELISGTTSLLGNQAKCPFKAFAGYRLNANSVPIIKDGLSDIERGKIIHHVMELLWRNLSSHSQLLELTPRQLELKIKAAINRSLADIVGANRYSFGALVQNVESQRLYELASACVERDRQRAPFFIAAVEQKFNLELAGINFSVRVDRIDLDSFDKKMVIDYKSSLPSRKPWDEERPEEPQLLLYALLDSNIDALLFIQLKSANIIYSGLSAEPSSIAGLVPLKKNDNWALRQQQWQQQLIQLSLEFKTGHCPPSPARISICKHCDFSNLCRVNVV